MKDELNKYLFREGAYTYAVLDGASVPDLPNRLFEMGPRHSCLYRGELSDEMIHVAPYMVLLEQNSEFSDWLFSECWGKHWGIFAQCPLSPGGMRRQLRSILTVDDDLGNPMLFRYYDPRVLVPFLVTCTIEELKFIFGEIKYFFAESFDRSEICRMHILNDALVETRLGFGENAEKAL
ncbi:MAG: DUF4123 domain-containing protein [Acidobacteria bacterium]|nr:MAG: DUF4123 domain-containing protein [Acidobacteriota bacterium]